VIRTTQLPSATDRPLLLTDGDSHPTIGAYSQAHPLNRFAVIPTRLLRVCALASTRVLRITNHFSLTTAHPKPYHNCTAVWRAHRRGALFGNPCFTQIHPTCIPLSSEHQSKLTLMSESLRNDGRVWVPKKKGETRAPKDIPENERDYYLESRYPSFGNLVPRDVASRNAK